MITLSSKNQKRQIKSAMKVASAISTFLFEEEEFIISKDRIVLENTLKQLDNFIKRNK